MNKIKIAKTSTFKPNEISTYIRSIFDQFIASEYTQEGVDEFYKYIEPNAIEERQNSNHKIIVAINSDNNLVGLIEIRDFNHVAMLFVKADMQRRGIGKMLLSDAIDYCKSQNSDVNKLTVNSSPNSVEAYKHMGFSESNDEQAVHGIRFMPMEKKVDHDSVTHQT